MASSIHSTYDTKHSFSEQLNIDDNTNNNIQNLAINIFNTLILSIENEKPFPNPNDNTIEEQIVNNPELVPLVQAQIYDHFAEKLHEICNAFERESGDFNE